MFIKPVALLALLFILSVVLGVLFVLKKLHPAVCFSVLVLLFGAVCAALVVPAGRRYLNIPVGTPEEATELYCSAVSDGNTGLADSLLKAESVRGLIGSCATPEGQYLLDSVIFGIRVHTAGETEVTWDGASRTVSVTCPVVLLEPGIIAADTAQNMERVAAERPRSIVYNDDRTYKPELRDEFFDGCFYSHFEESGWSEASEEVLLELICENGSWVILSDEDVYAAVAKNCGTDLSGLAAMFDDYVNAEYEQALEKAQYVPKHFSIDFYETVAPEPDPARFGVTTDPNEVQAVVDGAAELLEGQSLVWSPDVTIFPGSDIRYYCDDSILAIVWREEYIGTCCTFAEIKVADASQLRRKLVNDTFDPPTSDWKEATVLSDMVNAVVATGSDLYGFRNLGIFSYGGQLYRNQTNYVDSCHITYGGDMLFTHRYELADPKEAQDWITENDIMFSLAFGPTLVENYEPIFTYGYAIGEIWDEYARAAMGQIGDEGSLHYLMLVMNLDNSLEGAWRNPRLDEIRDVMYYRGCRQAYALDGGQTAIVIINDEKVTQVTPHGWERIYSDILYFASAIPPEERLG